MWLAAIFVEVPALLGNIFGISNILLLAAVWVAWIFPLSDRLRFAFLEIGYFGASITAIWIYGVSPGLPVLLGLFILVATVYHDLKGGVLAGVASLLLIAFGAWGWIAGFLPKAPVMPQLNPAQFDVWMRILFGQLLAACAITGTVAYILRDMRAMIRRLRLAEEKFSKAFRTCPDAMVITELESGRFIEVNDSHMRLTGYSREEVIGRTSVEIGTFSSVQDRASFVELLRAKGSARKVERQITDRQGRTIDVMYSSECIDLEGLRCALTIIQDVSDHKRTEAALVANEERFRSFIENASVGIYRSTPEGRIVLANPAFLRIMGYESFEETVSRDLERDSRDASYPRKEFRESIERSGQLSGWEATWNRRDGTRIFVRESAILLRGPDGGVQYYEGIIEDITERRMAEQALRESEERFRNLTAAAFEGIVITENGRILDINDQGLKMLGYERSEVIGHQAIDFVTPETRSIVAESIRSQRETAYEHQLVRKDGTRIQAEAQAKMMSMGGRTVRMTALRDITERRHAEQKQRNLEEQLRQVQKMEALGTLAGGIAHDFNNILTGILGNLQLVEMDLPTGHPAFVALKSADKASWRARDLVARILAFSRLEHDNRASASLGAVVLEAVQLLRVGLQGNIQIRTEIDPNCPAVVFDSGQVHQVIMNLGTNAAHAMRERGGLLVVKLRTVTPGDAFRERHPQVIAGHTVCLTLSDNGCGMEETVLKRIFEPFYTTKLMGHGTGLGLAMVHAIMKSHNGAIVVESAPGTGTTFDLYFPAASGTGPDVRPSAGAGRTDRLVAFGNGRKIMLVDDEEAVRVIGAGLLERLGFVAIACARPSEALGAFKADPASFCAVISDLTMPEMTGLELARHILAISPAVPIILTSGYLHSEAQQKARESGVRCVINKPFKAQELVAQIRTILGDSPSPGA